MLGPKILSEMLIPDKSLWFYIVLPLQLKCFCFVSWKKVGDFHFVLLLV